MAGLLLGGSVHQWHFSFLSLSQINCLLKIAESFEEVVKIRKKQKLLCIYRTKSNKNDHLLVLNYQYQLKVFFYRSEMNEISCNFKELNTEEIYICKCIMNNSHLYHCKVLNDRKDLKHNYEDLLNGTLHQQKYVLDIMKKNLEYFRTSLRSLRADPSRCNSTKRQNAPIH